MPIDYTAAIQPSEITPREVWLRRRELLAGAAALGLAGTVANRAEADAADRGRQPILDRREADPAGRHHQLQQLLRVRHRQGRPGRQRAHADDQPWTVKVDGLVAKPAEYQLEDILKPVTLEERIYRMRCVEGWSMVIPWVGFPLADLLKRVEPQGSAKYVAFETLVRPEEMPGQQRLLPVAGLALRRGPAAGRGDAPADHPGGRPLRRDPAQPERRADPAGRALEVRLQGHQVDRADQPGREAAADLLEHSRTPASTASTPTSIRRSTTRAGARRPSGASARAGCSPSAGRRCRSTAMPIRWPACTPAWTCGRTTDMAARPTCRHRALPWYQRLRSGVRSTSSA